MNDATITDADIEAIAKRGRSKQWQPAPLTDFSKESPAIVDSTRSQPIRYVDGHTAAQLISARRGKKLSREALFQLLRDHGYFTTSNEPKCVHIDNGLFQPCLTSYLRGDVRHYHFKPLITAKGIAVISELLDNVDSNGDSS